MALEPVLELAPALELVLELELVPELVPVLVSVGHKLPGVLLLDSGLNLKLLVSASFLPPTM